MEYKTMKKAIPLALGISLIGSAVGNDFLIDEKPVYAAELTQSNFNDISQGYWAYKEIQFLKDKGIAEALTGNLFKPNDMINRADAARMLVKALGLALTNIPDVNYSDVTKSHPDYNYIAIATREGIFSGKGNGTFGPEEPLTRGQMAKVIVETFDFKGVYPKPFKDISNYWAKDYILALAANEVTTGYLDATFKPNNKTTRAQMSAFIYRAINGSIFQDPEIKRWSSTDYYVLQNGFIYFKGNDGKQSPYMINEKFNSLVNQQIYALSKAIVNTEKYTEIRDGDDVVHISSARNPMFVAAGNSAFSYMLFKNGPFNNKANFLGYEKFSENVFMVLQVGQFYETKEEKDIGGNPIYKEKLEDSLLAVFGSREGTNIYKFVMSEIDNKHKLGDSYKNTKKIKEFDTVKIDFSYSGDLSFYFSYKK